MRTRSLGLSLLIVLAVLLGAVAPVSGEGEGDATYTVRPGDALEKIARRYATTVADLARLNGLRNPDRIKIGQQLVVPGQLSGSFHVVAAADTLEDIAAAHGISVADLIAANQPLDTDFLQVGQQLALPPARSGAARGSQTDEGRLPYLQVPYRSQFDGSTYADSNCGPATLGMLMAYDGEWWSSNGIRRDVNRHTGVWSDEGGSSWESLVYAAQKRGFTVLGLYGGKGYRRWSIDDLLTEVRSGRPPMLLVRYWRLPGHEYSSWWGDHYIIFLGLTADGRVVYHDSAFEGDSIGAYRTMSQDQLKRAWGNNAAGIQYSAMVLQWQKGGE